MTQFERLGFLLEYLLEEDKKYAGIRLPDNLKERRDLFERLMKIRPITTFSREFRQVYTEYLAIEKERSQVVTVSDLTPLQPHFYLFKGSLRSLQADAIVSSDAEKLEKELLEGTAVIEVSRELPYSHIIYAKPPQLEEAKLTYKDYQNLSQSYWDALDVAACNKCRTIAFHQLDEDSTQFPAELSARIAVDTFREYMRTTRKSFDVIFNVSQDNDYQIYQRLLCDKHL